jgi:hypothetical protein
VSVLLQAPSGRKGVFGQQASASASQLSRQPTSQQTNVISVLIVSLADNTLFSLVCWLPTFFVSLLRLVHRT